MFVCVARFIGLIQSCSESPANQVCDVGFGASLYKCDWTWQRSTYINAGFELREIIWGFFFSSSLFDISGERAQNGSIHPGKMGQNLSLEKSCNLSAQVIYRKHGLGCVPFASLSWNSELGMITLELTMFHLSYVCCCR